MADPKLVMMFAVGMLLLLNGLIAGGRVDGAGERTSLAPPPPKE